MNIFDTPEFRFAAPYRDGKLLVTSKSSNSLVFADRGGEAVGGLMGDFAQPDGIAYDEASGRVYVVDRYHHCVKVFDEKIVMESVIGNELILNQPVGIALDGNRIYVADNENHRVAVFDKEGNLVDSIGSGYGSGYGEMFCPCGVAIYNGLLIVAEWGGGRVQIFKDGNEILIKEGFPHAHDVKVDKDGVVHVAVYSAKQVRSFKILGIDGEVVTTGEEKTIQLDVEPTSLFIQPDDGKLGIVTRTKLIRVLANV